MTLRQVGATVRREHWRSEVAVKVAEKGEAVVGTMPPGPGANHAPVERAAVQSALRTILESEQFRTAPQLSAFLTFVVQRTLEGRSSEIKGYTIATEALNRPQNFDPQSDPIVRVEAMRLRRALDGYYAGPGGDDPVRILLPRGGYVPIFQMARAGDDRSAVAPIAHPLVAPATKPAPRSIGAAVVCLGLFLLLAGFVALVGPSSEPATAKASDKAFARIEAQVIQADTAEQRRFASDLVDALAAFDEIDVIDLSRRPLRSMRPRDGQDYHLTISFRGEAANAGLRLTQASTGFIVWTESIPADRLADPDAARDFATMLGQPYGIVFADMRARASVSAHARCIIRAYDYMVMPDAETHAVVRACLEDVIAEEGPVDPTANYALTRVYADEDRLGFNTRPQALDRALSVANAALRAAPASARAHQAMMVALFARRDRQAALAIGRTALSLNPADTSVMADLAARLVRTGDYRGGAELIRRSLQLNPAAPLGASFHAVVAARLMGDKDLLRQAAARLTPYETPILLIAQISATVTSGDDEAAAAIAARLAQLDPAVARAPERLLAQLNLSDDIVEALAADVRKAGGLAVTAPTAATQIGAGRSVVPQ